MTRVATPPDLALNARGPRRPLLRWLCGELRSAILDGRLKRGGRLPSTRDLSRRYGVSRGTAVAAFEELESEGYLEGRVGAGTFVSASLPEDLLHAKRRPGSAASAGKVPIVLSRFGQSLRAAPGGSSWPARAFRAGEPALDGFPLSAWARIAGRRLRQAGRALLAEGDSRGYRPLREAIADYLGVARGVRCTAEQVLVVSGIQQALDLTARLVLDPGDLVWVEDPCFFGVPAMFRALQAKLVPVPVDQQGIDVEAGRRRGARAKLAYVTPAHQFPLGPTMTLDRRLALLEWARRSGALIFEDDYDSEYRYSGRPIPAVQGLDTSGSVVFAGSFGKVLLPSLRLGYVVVPETLIEKFAAARFVTDRFSSVLDQAILCDFLTEGHFGRHIRRMRELYASRLAALRAAVDRRLLGLLRLQKTEAGIQTVGWLSEGLNGEVVAQAAAAANIEVIPISRFAVEAARPEGLLLGFAAVDAAELTRGVDKLAAVLEACIRKRRPRLSRTTGGSATSAPPRSD